jgi:predicted regulator of Ras-like GTPase activity (Roadblock/LC7/MglB family)
MILPEGKSIGVLKSPLQEIAPLTTTFTGAMEVSAHQGEGVILVEKGKILAAYYRDRDISLRGKEALERVAVQLSPEFCLRRYEGTELENALLISKQEGLLIPEDQAVQAARPPPALDEAKLKKIKDQHGVLAISAFFEGFAVQSLGDADFDQVAAMAEDLLRAGTKIAADMSIGLLDQMILETAEGKCIIAPYGDLYLCVLTRADMNLGLIRVAIKSIQSEVN